MKLSKEVKILSIVASSVVVISIVIYLAALLAIAFAVYNYFFISLTPIVSKGRGDREMEEISSHDVEGTPLMGVDHDVGMKATASRDDETARMRDIHAAISTGFFVFMFVVKFKVVWLW